MLSGYQKGCEYRTENSRQNGLSKSKNKLRATPSIDALCHGSRNENITTSHDNNTDH